MTQTGIRSGGGAGYAEYRKFVLFRLAGETYGLDILQLREIIAKYQLTVLPNLPEFFRGVLGLRGEPIPIVNLRRRFGFGDAPKTELSRVIIVDMKPSVFGIEVDEVQRVSTFAMDKIEQAPALSSGERLPFVTGVSELDDGKLVIFLDMERVLNGIEQVALAEIGDSIRDAYRDSKSGGLAGLLAREPPTATTEAGPTEG